MRVPLAGGSVTPDSDAPYHFNDVVTLSQTPNSGYTFSAWSGDGVNSGGDRVVTITGNMTVTATYTQNEYTLTFHASPLAGGSVTPDSDAPYHFNDVVTLSQTPNSGYTFSAWSGDGVNSGGDRVVTITGNMTVTATYTFDPGLYTLTTSTAGTGAGSIQLNPAGGSYVSGTVVTVTAVPTSGSFTVWSGDLTGSVNPTTITMNADKDITAKFTRNSGGGGGGGAQNFTLNVSVEGTGNGLIELDPAG